MWNADLVEQSRRQMTVIEPDTQTIRTRLFGESDGIRPTGRLQRRQTPLGDSEGKRPSVRLRDFCGRANDVDR